MLVADIGEAQRNRVVALQRQILMFATLDGHLCQDDYTLLMFYAWEHISCLNKLYQSVGLLVAMYIVKFWIVITELAARQLESWIRYIVALTWLVFVSAFHVTIAIPQVANPDFCLQVLGNLIK